MDCVKQKKIQSNTLHFMGVAGLGGGEKGDGLLQPAVLQNRLLCNINKGDEDFSITDRPSHTLNAQKGRLQSFGASAKFPEAGLPSGIQASSSALL